MSWVQIPPAAPSFLSLGGPLLNPWKRISSRIPYQNSWIRVREDSVVRPDGQPGVYGVVELRPSVGVVALNEHAEIVLVGQWRYPTESYSWEIPRGGSHTGECDLLSVARRELYEETGVEAAEWRELGDFDLCNGVLLSTERIFLATSLRLNPQPDDPAEPVTVRWVTLQTAVDMVLANEIREATSVGALLKAHALLQR